MFAELEKKADLQYVRMRRSRSTPTPVVGWRVQLEKTVPQWKEPRIERRALQWQEPRRESELSRRVKQCLEENCKEEKVVDIERLTLSLCTTYPKYARRNQAVFKAQVPRITLMLE